MGLLGIFATPLRASGRPRGPYGPHRRGLTAHHLRRRPHDRSRTAPGPLPPPARPLPDRPRRRPDHATRTTAPGATPGAARAPCGIRPSAAVRTPRLAHAEPA
ncbi:hypothetical protein TPA0910_48490 [Streptomyces hygroscopicus subsp. sporocinereus]|uniref:Uncharacterized protein n=1 Tax=Streptomyces hygroscopicus TaxID=1912 RepID=A0ABQ3U466_STRHY|nr:hypothetical protein TPA0910_48490 [Streptomyces hygroscopicus]